MALDLGSIALCCVLAGDGSTPPASGSISGIVRGTRSGPIGGARVWIVPSRPFRFEFDAPARKLAETTADGSGHFSIDVPPLSGLVDVGAEATGFQAGAALAVGAGETIELALDRSFWWVGVVRDLDGRPVAGARFAAHAGAGALIVERSATSDEHGSYRLEAVPDDPRELRPVWFGHYSLEAAGFAPASPSLRLFAEPQAGEFGAKECRVDFWLGRGESLSGVVTDRESGRPIEGAHLLLTEGLRWLEIDSDGAILNRPPDSKTPHAITDRRGAFLLQHLPWSPESSGAGAGIGRGPPLELLAFAPGYVASVLDVTPAEEGATLRLEVALERAGALRIVAPPVAGPMFPYAVVRVEPERPPDARLAAARGKLLPYRRDLPANGTVEVGGVPRGRCNVRIEVLDDGDQVPWKSPDHEVLVAAGAVTEVARFDLPPSVAIRLYLSDESGAPLAGADVTATSPAGRFPSTTSDASGRAEIAAPASDFEGATSCRLRVAPHGIAARYVEAPRSADGAAFEAAVRFEHLVRWSGTCRRGDGQMEVGARIVFLDGALPLDEALARWHGTGGTGVDDLLLGLASSGEGGRFRSPWMPGRRAHVIAWRGSPSARPAEREEVALPNVEPSREVAIRFAREKDPARLNTTLRSRTEALLDLRLTDASSGAPIRQVDRFWVESDFLLDQRCQFQPVAPGRFRMLRVGEFPGAGIEPPSNDRLVIRGFVAGRSEVRVPVEEHRPGLEPKVVECALLPARTFRFRLDPENRGYGTTTLRVERLPDLALVATADPDVVRDLPAGRYRVCSGTMVEPVRAESSDWIASEPFDVPAGETPSHRDVIVKTVRAHALTVHWSDRFVPADGDQFELRGEDGAVVASIHGAPPDGWSRLLAEGGYEWALSRSAGAPLKGSFRIDRSDVNVELAEK